MGTFVFTFIILVLSLWILSKVLTRTTKTKLTKELTESELVKKFNKLVKSITSRNLETVESELLDILEKYRDIKCENFINAKTRLEKSKLELKNQLEQVKNLEKDMIKNIAALKSDTTLDEAILVRGGQHVFCLEHLRHGKNKLIESIDLISEKLVVVNNNITTFNQRYAIKKAEIIAMIANATTIENASDIDLKLNDLVSEFDTKVRENKIKDEVRGEIYGIKSDKDWFTDFNAKEWVEKFKNSEY